MSTASILVVDDELDIRTLIEEILTEEGYRVSTAGDAEEARRRLAAESPDLVLLDIWMPDTDGITLLGEWSQRGDLKCPVVIMSGHGTVETAVEATRLGAIDFVEKPLSIAKLLRTVEHGLRAEQAAPAAPPPQPLATVGKSARMQMLRQQIERVARRDIATSVVGESGTGREVCARAVHALSVRQGGPFVAVNAASIPAENAASQLLGGQASDGIEPGCLDRAAGGILFVGNIQDLCSEGQRILQGVIEQRHYSPLGHARTVPMEARVIASISPEASAAPEKHGVRPELLAVLTQEVLRVPALRERAEDVPELLQQHVDCLVDSRGYSFRRFGVAAQNRLRHYPWPGNLRELVNVVDGLLAAGGAEEIGLTELEAFLATVDPVDTPLVERDLLSMPLREAREHFERAYLTEQLLLCDGKVGQLAKRVGMERTHLYRKLRSLGVEFKQSRGNDARG